MRESKINIVLGPDGTARGYDDEYSVTIMHDSKEEMERTMKLLKNYPRWIPIEEKLPDPDELILLSFENATFCMIGRYTVDDDDSGTFRIGDDDETFAENDLFVNAWMRLPDPYRRE